MNRRTTRSLLSAALVVVSITLPSRSSTAQDPSPQPVPPAGGAAAEVNSTLAEGNIAYVYKTNLGAANDFKTFLESNGYGVTLVPVTATLVTNFLQYDIALIGDDTGFADQWGTESGQARHIGANTHVMGIGEGGYAFFGQLSMKIGYPNGAHISVRAVKGDALSSVFNIPNNLSAVASILPIYVTNLNTVGISLTPTIPAGTTVLGSLAPHEFPLYAPLIAEGCHQLWGFSGRPGLMNPNGKKLLINALDRLQGQCSSALGSCSIVKSATSIPAPGVVNFDGVATNTAISLTYKTLFGVTFSTQIRALANGTAHSAAQRGLQPAQHRRATAFRSQF